MFTSFGIKRRDRWWVMEFLVTDFVAAAVAVVVTCRLWRWVSQFLIGGLRNCWKKNCNVADVKDEVTTPLETDYLDVISFWTQQVLTQKTLARELPVNITSVFYDALSRVLKVLWDVHVWKSSRYGEAERLRVEGDCLFEKVEVCKREEERIDKTLV